MSEPIAILPKNSFEEIRIGWTEYKGKRYLDARIYAKLNSQPDMAPTKRGLALKPEAVPALIEALQKATGSDPLRVHRSAASVAESAPVDGIRARFAGVLDKGAEVRDKEGKPWLSFSALADMGETLSPVRIAYFGTDAAELAPRLVEGASVYVEGRLGQHEGKGLGLVARLVQIA